MRGRDIKRYYYDWKDLWVIETFPAFKLGIDDFPALKDYMESFGNRLNQDGKPGHRKKTGNQWFETQDQISYYSEFEKEKVVWAETDQNVNTVMVPKAIYLNKTCFMVITSRPKYISGLLNSVVSQWYIRYICPSLGEKGMTLGKDFVQQLPIPHIIDSSKQTVSQIESLVDQILAQKKQNPNADTSEFEKQINYKVYELYGLNDQEIKIIEESIKYRK